MRLAYQASDKSGRQIHDTIESPDADSAAEVLRRRGLYVTQIEEAAGLSSAGPARSRAGARGRGLKNLALFTRQLSVLVSSGTPLVDAFGALERQAGQDPWRDAISRIRRRIEEGNSLSAAMETRPEFFDPIYCSLIAAGESSGNLPAMLDRLAGFKQKQWRTRNMLIGAMVYPSLLVTMSIVVLAVLLSFVVPRFAGLFETLEVPLPASTSFLMAVSEIIRSYWWAILIVLAGSIIALRKYLISPAGRRFSDTVILRLPQIGNIARGFAMARITRLLGVLLQGRVPVLEALRLTKHAAGNVHYIDMVTRAEDLVTSGEPIYSAFSDTNLVSPSICETIRNGEQSGQIGPMLLHVADFLDDENEIVLRSLTSIIEPVILIIMGLVVAVVAISLFMPLFDLTAMMEGAS